MTLGSTEVPTYYLDKANTTLSDSNEQSTFSIANISLGTVYTKDGSDSSEYFEEFSCTNNTSTCNNTVQFNLNVQGLLLPGSIWQQFQSLVDYVLPETTCDQYDSGVCTLNKACSEY